MKAERLDAATIRRPEASASDSIPLIIGHRGASTLAPENTLAAFARAFADGADGLELDVRLARDGVPVVMRDGAVGALTSLELREVDAGSWFNLRSPELARAAYARECVPTLAEVLQLAGERICTLYVELKFERGEDFAPLVAEVVRLIRASSFGSRVVVESFALKAVKESKRIAPEIRAAALFERKLARPVLSTRAIISRALECKADEIALHYTLANRRTIEAARLAGLDALVWTVDKPTWIKRAQTLGLRALITNHPARMRAAKELL
jgi:glycerophosphoryl diester phosphodiesterase